MGIYYILNKLFGSRVKDRKIILGPRIEDVELDDEFLNRIAVAAKKEGIDVPPALRPKNRGNDISHEGP